MREYQVEFCRKSEMHTTFYEGTQLFNMRPCYPLFPTDVWSMILQIFLKNTGENADTLATPLKKAQNQFINKITTEYCIIIKIL